MSKFLSTLSQLQDTPVRKTISARVRRFEILLLFVLLSITGSGCGTFVAHRIAQAPNSYPTWFAPTPRVMLGFSPKFLTNFPLRFVAIGPPAAKMAYRVVNPADYHVKVSSSNWVEHGRPEFEFDFHADIPAQTNQWTSAPRGTVILLHGYGLAQFSMAPWALRLAQEGWRCVMVDLRGHGKSTGDEVFFGTRETNDLSQLLDQLNGNHQLVAPVAVMGESYGGALALRWKTVEPRVGPVIAIAPYGVLSNAVMNIARDYVDWMPRCIVRAGAKQLPYVLKVSPAELDTTTVLARNPVAALFIAGTEDKIMPPADVAMLKNFALPDSELVTETGATHESLTYYFSDLVPPVIAWLENAGLTGATAKGVVTSPAGAEPAK